jgi:hypothetical protein
VCPLGFLRHSRQLLQLLNQVHNLLLNQVHNPLVNRHQSQLLSRLESHHLPPVSRRKNPLANLRLNLLANPLANLRLNLLANLHPLQANHLDNPRVNRVVSLLANRLISPVWIRLVFLLVFQRRNLRIVQVVNQVINHHVSRRGNQAQDHPDGRLLRQLAVRQLNQPLNLVDSLLESRHLSQPVLLHVDRPLSQRQYPQHSLQGVRQVSHLPSHRRNRHCIQVQRPRLNLQTNQAAVRLVNPVVSQQPFPRDNQVELPLQNPVLVLLLNLREVQALSLLHFHRHCRVVSQV